MLYSNGTANKFNKNFGTGYLFGSRINSLAAIDTAIGKISGAIRACYLSGCRLFINN